MFYSLEETNSWYPQLGDIIVVRPRQWDPKTEEPYVGFIYKRGKLNGSNVVHVMWADENRKPPYYRHEMGYLVTNIHNLSDEFQLFRNGKAVRKTKWDDDETR